MAMKGRPRSSRQQAVEALKKGNATRAYRSELKRRLKHGDVTLWEVLEENDSRIATMAIGDLLVAVPGIGRVRVNRALREAQTVWSQPLKRLSMARRRQIAGLLPGLTRPDGRFS
jgi:hypothetical protein